MCKHVLNAQVSIRAPCCKQWFDCPQCHAENTDHPLMKTTVMHFICKKCRKAFRKDMAEWDDESDKFCPYCDNCFILPAVTPEDAAKKKGKMVLELEQSGGAKATHAIDFAELDEMEKELEQELMKDLDKS